MNNHTLLWASFIIPWLSLLFLKNEDVRRYMPVALFAGIITTIVMEFGIVLGWWLPTEDVFPFLHMSIFSYGAYLVGTVWIFKYTYGHIWKFLATNAVIDFVLDFGLSKWFIQLGLFEVYMPSYQLFFITISLAFLLYGYQMWQSGELKIELVPHVKPAAVKPLVNDPADELDERKD